LAVANGLPGNEVQRRDSIMKHFGINYAMRVVNGEEIGTHTGKELTAGIAISPAKRQP
jgi:hypothetical protein